MDQEEQKVNLNANKHNKRAISQPKEEAKIGLNDRPNGITGNIDGSHDSSLFSSDQDILDKNPLSGL